MPILRRTLPLALLALVAIVLLAIRAGTGPAFAQDPAPPPPPSAAQVTGPAKVLYSDVAVFEATVAGEVTGYTWSVVGDNGVVTPSKDQPNLARIAFTRAGVQTVQVRATGPGGAVEASLAVTVERPDQGTIAFEPSIVVAGQPVRMVLQTKSEPSRKPRYFSWRIGGIKPKERILKLKGAAAPRALGLRAAAPKGSPEIRLRNATPTLVPRLAETFPKAGTYPVRVSTVGTDGRETLIETSVRVLSQVPSSAKLAEQLVAPPAGTFGCATLPAELLRCPAIVQGAGGHSVNGPVHLTNGSPSSDYCVNKPEDPQLVPRNPIAGLAPFVLPYPDPTQYGTASAYEVKKGVAVSAPRSATTPTATAAQEKEKLGCVIFPNRVAQWRFGHDDATDPAKGVPGDGPQSVLHRFPAAGEYTVTMVTKQYAPSPEFAKVVYALPFAANPSMGTVVIGQNGTKNLVFSDAEVNQLVAEGKLREYVVGVSTKVRVQNEYCGVVRLQKAPARAYVGSGDPFNSPDSCFLVELDANGKETPSSNASERRYRVLDGSTVSLNGIRTVPVGSQTPGYLLVDGPGNAIYTTNDAPLQLTFYEPKAGPSAFTSLGQVQRIDVPKPAVDPDFGVEGSLLPDFGKKFGTGVMHGFPIKSARVLLRENVSASARVALDIPPGVPLSEATPLITLGGTPGAKAAGDGNPDFEIDLSGIKIGPIRSKEFKIKHFPAPQTGLPAGVGVWEGGGKFAFNFGKPFKGDLNAAYKPQGGPFPKKCSELGDSRGPSGLRITDEGKFLHAGAAINAKIPLGPVDLTCLGGFFTKEPFVIRGLLAAGAPTGKNVVAAEGCVQVAVMKANETIPGCPSKSQPLDLVEGAGESYTSKQEETWINVRAGLSALGGKISLADGGIDVHTGNDLTNVSGFVQLPKTYFGPWRIQGYVDGLIIAAPDEKKGFQFRGKINLAYGACPACADVLAFVSSKGVGACVDVLFLEGGFLYKFENPNKGLKLFGGCDFGSFAPIAVKASAAVRTDFRSPPTATIAAGETSRTFTVGRNVEAVALNIEGAGDAAPIVTVTGPGVNAASPRTGDAGETTFFKRVGKVGFGVTAGSASREDRQLRLELQKGRSIVTIDKPTSGKYTVAIQAGSPTIASAGISQKLPERRITAEDVKLGDGTRMLKTSVSPVPGQTVEFFEQSTTPEVASCPVPVEASMPSAPGRPAPAAPARCSTPPAQRLIGTVGPAPKKNGVRQHQSKTLKFPSGFGTKGPRKVVAVISQDGVPIKEIPMPKASFTAPGPPKVPAPTAVTVTQTGRGTIRACWNRVKDAKAYDVVFTSGLGRREVVQTTAGNALRPCAVRNGYYKDVGASVSVTAVTDYGRTAKPSGRNMAAVRPPARAYVYQP